MKLIPTFLVVSLLFFPSRILAQRWCRTYNSISNSIEAEEFLRQKGREFEASGDHANEILADMLLGDHFEKEGLIISAESSYLAAKSLVDKRIKSRRGSPYLGNRFLLQTTLFDVYDRLGELYLNAGNYEKSKELFLESLDRRSHYFSKKSIHCVRPLIGLAAYHLKQEYPDSSIFFLKRSLHGINKATTTFFNYNWLERDVYSMMSTVAIQRGQFALARKAISRLALSSSGGLRSYDSKESRAVGFATTQNLKSELFFAQGDIKLAEHYLKKARLFLRDIHDVTPLTMQLLRNQALISWVKGDYSTALEAFTELLEASQHYIVHTLPYLTSAEKDIFLSGLKKNLDLFNYFASYTLRHYKNIDVASLLFDTAIKHKALLLNESIKLKKSIFETGSDSLITVLQKWKDTKQLLSSNYLQRGTDQIVDSLERHANLLERSLVRSPKVVGYQDGDTLTWKTLANSLKEHEAALELLRIERPGDVRNLPADSDPIGYVAMVVRHNSSNPNIVFISDGQNLDSKYLNFYRNAIKSQHSDSLLYLKYWSAISNELDGVTCAYVSPDGVYNLINLNTLMNPQSGNYVLDEIRIVYLTNTKDLARHDERSVTTPLRAFLFGRPDFDYGTNESEILASNEQYSSDRGLRDDQILDIKSNRFEDLPGTALEVNSIKKLLIEKSYNVEAYTGADASEGRLKQLDDAYILHIATHGYFLSKSTSTNMLIKSGIALRGANNSMIDSSDDGILTAFEAADLNLNNTKLVILSACETGLGDVKNGEGVYGLQRAFMIAGARNVIMSLWRVDDIVTSKLMTSFYGHWISGKTITESFASAQAEIRTTNSSPYYWGAFILLGND